MHFLSRTHAILPLALLMVAVEVFGADGNNILPWRQDQPPNQPYSPQEAVAKMTVPQRFTVELVASEPEIVNPIGMCFDDRGRIWITESVEYPRKPAGVGRDKVKVLEDTNGNGRADKVTIFAEGLNIPTGVAVGYGGVWVLNAPDLLFMREKDGKAISREVVLTGFGRTDTHELPNSLTWGPDGWLYGLNGVFNQSRIRSKNGKEYQFNCALWRVHPRTHEFQIVSEGTSNPYGIGWDAEGSAIVEACHWANDHLFHFVETGHYQRQAGTFPPFTTPIGAITDHGHQKTAYCGLAILDTDAYPAQYRGRVVVGNIHGGALNVDRLERDGATYLAKAEPDLLSGNDAWFMPVSLKIGPDGCLYVLDWYDRYHCSQDSARDPEGVDRLKGRLYRLRYGEAKSGPKIDLLKESDDQLIRRLSSGNIYYRETAQRILTERLSGAAGARGLRGKLERLVLSPVAAEVRRLISDSTQDQSLLTSAATVKGDKDQSLLTSAATDGERKARLHALWVLIGGGALDSSFHLRLLTHADATHRAWGVRAAGNYGIVSSAIRKKIAELAHDSSPDVQLQVAIASRKIRSADALPILTDVLESCGHDKVIPSIAWNNLHPLLETESARFVSGCKRWSPAISALSRRAVERMLSSKSPKEAAVARFMQWVGDHDQQRLGECLSTVAATLPSLNEPALAKLRRELKPLLESFQTGTGGGIGDSKSQRPNQSLVTTADSPQKEAAGSSGESSSKSGSQPDFSSQNRLGRLSAATSEGMAKESVALSARLLAARLGLVQLDPASIRAQFTSRDETEGARLQALDALIAFRDPELIKTLPEVLTLNRPGFVAHVFPALGRFDEPKLGDVILASYPKLAPELQLLAVDLMMQREPWARKLLDAVLANKLPKTVLNANHLRKILESDDRDALWAVEKAFGKVREERNPEREKVVAQMASYFREHLGDPRRGQTVFRNFCAQCHTIYGEGGKLGPDITANGRASFEQLLSNVFDPSLVIGPGYQVTTVVTADGRNLTGLIAEDNDQRIVVRMPGEGEETVPRHSVKYTRASKLSMMPEGIETLLDRKDLEDLFAFLALDKPPGDPGAKLIPGAPAISSRPTPPGQSSRLKVEQREGRLVVKMQKVILSSVAADVRRLTSNSGREQSLLTGVLPKS